jgi:hypothetical protein
VAEIVTADACAPVGEGLKTMDEKPAIRTEVFQSFGCGSQGFSLIDAEEGLAGFVFPIGPNGESPNMRLTGSCVLRRPIR